MVEAKTVLVTGGAGFIASHLVDRLLSLGHRVAVVDNLSTGHLRNLNKQAVFYHADITEAGLDEIFQREHPQIVSHHAAQASVTESVINPIKDAEVNVLGILRLLEACRKHGVEKFVFASSGGAIYGEPQYLPCDEAHTIQPLAPYGLTKRIGEQYLELYRNSFQLNYVALRYGNIYGPRQDPHGEAAVLAIFARTMLEGKQPKIFGNGEQERDFVFVDDVVEANILAFERGEGATYNIGSGQGTSINRIFEIYKGILNYRWAAAYEAPRSGEVFKVSLDSSKAAQELGWTPKVSLEEGMRLTADYCRRAVQAAT